MQVEGMHPWWDEEEEKRRAAAMKTREPEPTVNENSFYAGAVKGGIMGTLGNKKFETIKDYEKAIGETEKTIVDLSHQQYEHMMNGDQPKMDALTPVIGQALNVRDQLRVEMGNQMGLGADGWASQGKSYTGSYETQLKNKDEITEFVKKVKEAEANIPGDQGMYGRNKGSAPIYEKVIPVTEIPKGQSPFDDPLPILEPYIIDPNKKREDIKEFLLSDVGDQSKPRGGGGFNNPLGMNGYGNNRVQFAANDSVPMMGLNDQEQEYIDSMSQTFGGMSEGLEAVQANTRESIVNSLSPELRSKADVYVGEANVLGISDGNTNSSEQEDDDESSTEREDRIAELREAISEGPKSIEEYLSLSDFERFQFDQLMQELKMIDPFNFDGYIRHSGETISEYVGEVGFGSLQHNGEDISIWPNNWSLMDAKNVESHQIDEWNFNIENFLMNFELDDNLLQFIASTLVNAAESTEKVSFGVDIYETRNDEKKVILTYYDSRFRLTDLYNSPGGSSAFDGEAKSFKIPGEYGASRTYTIDKGHIKRPEMGYLYFEDGNLMLQPLILPNDRFLYKTSTFGKQTDVTEDMKKPMVLHDDMKNAVIKILEDAGYGVLIPEKAF